MRGDVVAWLAAAVAWSWAAADCCLEPPPRHWPESMSRLPSESMSRRPPPTPRVPGLRGSALSVRRGTPSPEPSRFGKAAAITAFGAAAASLRRFGRTSVSSVRHPSQTGRKREARNSLREPPRRPEPLPPISGRAVHGHGCCPGSWFGIMLESGPAAGRVQAPHRDDRIRVGPRLKFDPRTVISRFSTVSVTGASESIMCHADRDVRTQPETSESFRDTLRNSSSSQWPAGPGAAAWRLNDSETGLGDRLRGDRLWQAESESETGSGRPSPSNLNSVRVHDS